MSSPTSAGREELLALRPAHRTGQRRHDDVVEPEPVEDADVGLAVRGVRAVQAGVVDVEGVGVLHHELAAAQQAGPRPLLVAELGLDLVDPQRQVLVRRVEVLHQQGEELLVGRAEHVVGALAVLEPEHVVAVVGPAVALVVGLLGQQRREVHLLRAHRVHLVADDRLDLAQHPPARAAGRCSRRAPPGGCSRPRTSSRWLGTSASAGSSRRVRRNRVDIRSSTGFSSSGVRADGPRITRRTPVADRFHRNARASGARVRPRTGRT